MKAISPLTTRISDIFSSPVRVILLRYHVSIQPRLHGTKISMFKICTPWWSNHWLHRPKDLLAGLLFFFFSSNRRSAVLKLYKSWHETLSSQIEPWSPPYWILLIFYCSGVLYNIPLIIFSGLEMSLISGDELKIIDWLLTLSILLGVDSPAKHVVSGVLQVWSSNTSQHIYRSKTK